LRDRRILPNLERLTGPNEAVPMPDSQPGTPAPSDNGLRPDKKKPTPKRPIDEEAIDFDEQSPIDGNYHSGALSFKVSRSGPLSGSSVMPWSQLIKDNEDLGRELDRHEAKNDAELLRDALSQEPPPAEVKEVVEEAKLTEPPRPLPDDENDDDDDFHLGPLSDMDDASSIFGRAVGLRSDRSSHAWRQSSHVDLLGEERPNHDDATDELRRPPVDRSGRIRTGDANPADPPQGSADIESSAVDLGSKPETAARPSFVRQAQAGSSFHQQNGYAEMGSGHIPEDLLSAPSEIFDLATAGLAANRLNLDLDDKPQKRWKVWAGAGVFGLVVGAATYAAMWYTRALPDLTGSAESKPFASSTLQNAQEQARTAWRAEKSELQGRADEAARQARRAQSEYETLLAKLKSVNIDPAELPTVAARLAGEKAAVDEGRRAKEAYAALTAALKSANLDPSDVQTAVARLSQARAAAEAAALQAEAQSASLRSAAAASARDATAAEERLKAQLDRVAAARAALADFQLEVINRLKAVGAVSNESAPGDLIAALDAALQRHPGSSPRPNSVTAEREYGVGRERYRAGEYQAAEQAFDAAVKANERDARFLYFRGLCRWQQGRTEDAGRDFAKASDLERQSLPNPREIDFALERVQGGPRQALNRYRP
jgi:hypothetical protein